MAMYNPPCVFFPSRSRHTRFDCDWSSDVCSSDLVGLGAAGGALFGVAAKGGAELTETVAKYRAETGATAAEAEAAQASIGKLYKNNIAGFATLGDVLTRVHNDLGLTG